MSDSSLTLIRRAGLRYLTRRDHSEKELTQKLEAKGFALPDIIIVIAEFQKAGYLCDERFAEHYCRFRQAKGYGPERIALELKARGVHEALIAKQLEITDNTWLVLAQKAWKKRFKDERPRDFKTKAKHMRFLQYRGFTKEQIEQVFESAH